MMPPNPHDPDDQERLAEWLRGEGIVPLAEREGGAVDHWAGMDEMGRMAEALEETHQRILRALDGHGPHMTHRDGVPWWKAPLPRLIHRHFVQTRGSTSRLAIVDRCACGAIRLDGYGPWISRGFRERRR